MKLMKKLASLALALILVLALGTPALAAQEGALTGGSITITNAAPGQTYTAYQLLYIESYNADTGAYTYKANSEWETWLKSQTAYLEFDAQGYVTWVGNATEERAAEFAKLAQEQLASKSGETVTAGAAAAGSDTTTVTFSSLKLGYYLVDTTLGSLCSLDTTNPAATMTEKNDIPTIKKEVKEDSNNNYGKYNDDEIGQTVYFRTTIDIKEIEKSLTMHDTMSAGLTYTGVTSVKVKNTDVAAENYAVNITPSDGCTFEIVFTESYIKSLDAGTEIVVEYTATLNENAVVGLEGNPNTVKLEYGENAFTTEDQTKTYTWNTKILKYGNGDKTNTLEGAQFVLLRKEGDKVATFSNGRLTGWETVPADGSSWSDTSILTTDANGEIEIEGLDSDSYLLREIKAPDGYNKLSAAIEVKVNGAVRDETTNTLTYSIATTEVNNQSGAELPSTGGIGTTIFYIAGGVLVLAAVVLLVTRKRMNREG